MKLKINFIMIMMVGILIVSCEADGYADYDTDETMTQELSGEWFVSVYDQNGNRLTDYFLLSTYNTAANNDSIWVDDHESAFPLKVRALASLEDLTFSTESAPNLYVEDSTGIATASITNGIVIPEGGRASGSNNVVDSLAFEVQVSHDPEGPVLGADTLYIVGGYERTGFLEDEH